MEQVMLLGFWISPYVTRVKIALLEKGIKFQYKEVVDIFENLNKSHLLLRSNPIHEKVSVLIHNGKPICESLIILQYIDEIADCGRKMWVSKGEVQEGGKEEFRECLRLLENELGDKLYFEGDRFGLLDTALIPITCRFYTNDNICKFSVEYQCPRFM
ncbi:probable glutathione S-transferase [Prosopis cineraria]|uniref:probable glutathione S-transferase n=1 Tax=Prosopis cineraria TaxID=364024 RepID=UPI00240F134F|nr:probable glutathione S-transferase [Prosopis cineraria]